MRSWVLSPRARTDLDEIWDWSVAHWGEERAERYIRDLFEVIALAAADPRRGRSRDDIRAGYRSIIAGSHVIFYRTARAGIDVVRILHARMDFRRHV